MNMLRSIREKKGLTVSQLAARASIPSRLIADYEEGRQSIPLPHAKLIAKALWVQMEDLMPPAGSVPPPPPVQQPAPTSSIPTANVDQTRPVERPQQTLMPPVAVDNGANRAAPSTPIQHNNTNNTAIPQQATPVASQGAHSPQARQGEGQAQPSASAPAPQRGGANRATRPSRPLPPPPGPLSEGQSDELVRLANRLDISQEQLEERVGKSISTLTRPEAKDWIKRLRAMAEEIAPGNKVRFGRWPEDQEDREATYLAEQRDTAAPFTFKLFDSEQFNGIITDFTPYTITVKLNGDQEEVVLRKLAIVYYRRLPANGDAGGTQATQPQQDASAGTEGTAKKPTRKRAAAKSETGEEQHQPLDEGVASDRAGQPKTPEKDHMDEDRGL